MQVLSFKETPIFHAAGYLRFREGSGCVSVGALPMVQETLQVTVTDSAQTLSLIAKPGAVGLKLPSLQTLYTQGRAAGSDLDYPANTPFLIAGRIESASGQYHPRYFQFNVGNAQTATLAIYRSVAATRIGTAGAVYGNLSRLVDGQPQPEAWALVTLVLTPTVGAPLTFVAQANVKGDFLLPINRAPALDKDAPSPHYGAQLSVQRMAIETNTGLPNPAALSALEIEEATTENQYAANRTFNLVPGRQTQLVSANKTFLQVRPV